jgi:hypothetical protein
VVQDTSRNGNFVFGAPGDGGYEVAEDCSDKFFDAAGNEVSRIVVVDDGKEIYALSLMANTAIYGVFKKIDNRQKDHHR